MNLREAMMLYGGGPGSGCHGPNCGRPESGIALLSPRAQRALATYVPVTKAKYQLAKKNERAVASALGGVTTGNNAPFDVIAFGNIGIEVKTIIESIHDKITMHPEALREKKAEARRERFDKVFTVVADNRGSIQKWYVREGLGSFRLHKLKPLTRISDLRKEIHGV